MTVVYIISFLLIAFGIVRILGLTPESIGADVSAILDRKKSLRDNAMRARGKKRTNKLVLWLDKIRRALSDTGKEKSFDVACAVALLLMILGCVGAIVIGNLFLAPVLAIALAMIPFLYLLRTVEQYEEQVKLELETGLSAVTSSYERTMNLKNAVEENIDNLKPPVKGLFQSFLVEISVINPDVKAAICHLRERVKDSVWEEWCDMVNRAELLNGNSFITGVSGSGKSILAKQEIINLFLSDKDADIIIIDPEREYGKIMDAFGGENIEISATSKNHINAMDINMDYADGQNPVTLKSEYMLSLCEQAVCDLGPKQKSLIDRCTANLLNGYMRSGFCGKAPTLKDFYEELKAQPEPEAKDIALSLELFTSGSLDTFAGETNVDTKNRLICYDIHDLGRALMPIGMLVVLDNILNRITANKARGRKTYIFIDEIYLLFKHEYSANFLFTLWKRVRKYGAFITGITQNVEDLLQSHTARTMLANSELVVMLNQAATDREELASLMGISDLQMSYITNVDAGHGLVKIGGALVPFVNKVPKDTKLYALMTTKFGES